MLTKVNQNSEQSPLSATSQIDNDQRQVALVNLFSSLSSLANQQQQQQQIQHTLPPPPPPPQTKIQQTSPPPAPATSATSMALTSSIQSVVAAAMMQQQIVNAAINRQQPQQPHTQRTQQSIPAPAISFLGEQMRTSFPFGQALDQDEQLTGFNQPKTQQQQQRINYCTICNKELCNKYFMKTHMLKMHGINLEMEQPDDEGGSQEGGAEEDEVGKSKEQSSECSSSNIGNWSPQNTDKTFQNTAQNKNKTTTSTMRASLSPGSTKKSSSSSLNNKHTTSVMNGFAGNSMGGVVCDICNKELCSKYFLKVHKQNTHGIMTDYQDASQFVYPFVGPLAAPNPFIGTSPASIGLTPPAPTFSSNPLAFFNQSNQQKQTQDEKKPNSAKRPRLMVNKQQHASADDMSSRVGDNLLDTSDGTGLNGQLDSVYRLMLGRQQQQQQQQQLASQPSIVPIDQIAANPVSALMCFSAISPFGPAGMSPAMIVDYILRNQHLFNRSSFLNNNNDADKPSQVPGKQSKSGNLNSDGKLKSGKNVKEPGANNNKYFSHYTEACPMCDRRFKSIKWLKTHMLNDHKQEIGAYMQMIMQHLYTNKSQQVITAASMAAFGEPQQPSFSQIHGQQHLSNSILSKCFSLRSEDAAFQLSPQSLDSMPSFSQNQQRQQPLKRERLHQSSSFGTNLSISDSNRDCSAGAEDLIIDARCRQDSVSLGQHSPTRSSDSSIKFGHHQDTHLDLSLSYNIDKYNESRTSNVNVDFLLTAHSSRNDSPSVEDTSDDDGSDHSIKSASGDQDLSVKDLSNNMVTDSIGQSTQHVQIQTQTK